MTLSILKKRFTIWLLLIGMVVIVIAGFLSWRQDEKLAVEAVSWVISGRTFIIDPGHGGEDPGKVSPAGVLEKDINLAVAKKMQAIFVHGGAGYI